MHFPLPHAAIAPFCFTIGILAAVGAVLAYRAERRFLSTAQKTQGVVQSVRTERWKGQNMYFPVIRFTTAAGAVITAESKSGRASGYTVGQMIPINYDPAHPESMQVDAAWAHWLLVVGFGFIALVSFAIAINALTS